MNDTYTILEVADRLRTTNRTVYNYIRGFSGVNTPGKRNHYGTYTLDTIEINGKFIIKKRALIRFIAECDKESIFGTNYNRYVRKLQDIRCFTIIEAGEQLGFTRWTVYRYIKLGKLNAIMLPGGALRITPSQIKDFKSHL